MISDAGWESSRPDFLGRWIDLTADLLSRHGHDDPMIDICDELGRYYQAEAAGTIDFGATRARVGVYRSGIDPERYVGRAGEHPLSLHFRATLDPHVRSLDDARRFLDRPPARRLIDDLREENLVDFVYLPLRPRPGMDHRWLGLAAGTSLGSAVRQDLERIRPLVDAIDAQSRVLANCRGPARAERHALAVPELSARELSVLALVAGGLTMMAIGNRLSISPRTVSKHQQNIYRKLGVGDRLGAVLRGQQLGLLPAPSSAAPGRTVRSIEVAVI